MATMYEKIMLIPLFTGLSHAQISNFLEKTSILFTQYKEGEYICRQGDPVDSLICMIDGEISIQHNVGNNGQLIIEETIDSPISINSDRLFGIERSSSVSVKALRKTGIMEFKKRDFINLIDSNEIFKLNYLNSLSLKAQSSELIYDSYPIRSLQDFILTLLKIHTSKVAKSIRIHFNISDLTEYIGKNIDYIKTEMDSILASPNIQQIPTGIEIRKEFF